MNETEAIYGEGVVRTERVIERVEVVKPVYTALPIVDIGICGLTAGAGATFAAMALARAVNRMGVMASVVEVNEKVVESIAGEAYEQFCPKRAAVRFYDFSGSPGGRETADKIPDRRGAKNKILGRWETENMIPDKRGTENRMPEAKKPWIGEDGVDSLIIMIDPMPSKIVRGYECFQSIRAVRSDCVFVLNRTHKEVRRREIKDIFKMRKLYEIPFIEPAYIYTAERKSIPAADICFVRKQLDIPIQRILRRVLPVEILKLAKRPDHVIR